QIQYHNPRGRGDYLPAAEYSFVTQVQGRGVYSFCMCPGGVIVPAASGPEQVVVNGMSSSSRGSRWANSGMVVEIRPEDLPNNEDNSVLSIMNFQEELERNCWLNAGMKQSAPAQRMEDFIKKRVSGSTPETSYAPGVISSPLHFWMPEFVTSRLSEGFKHFGRVSRGFLTNEALMIGVESRTSAPVRIPRDRETLEHVVIKDLYPCGEGAGYAGGIVSAAIDGERCAESLIAKMNN
ncbi:MAG: NAD(P)/FAD-dependent oxidoreductase, partial [Bacteroidales bacterium]